MSQYAELTHVKAYRIVNFGIFFKVRSFDFLPGNSRKSYLKMEVTKQAIEFRRKT